MNSLGDVGPVRSRATLAVILGYVAFFIVLPCAFTYAVMSAWRLMLSCEPAGLAGLGLLVTASLLVSGGVPTALARLRPGAIADVPFDLRVFVLITVAIGTLILGFCLGLFVLAGIGLAAGRVDELYEAGVTVAKAIPLLLPAVGFTFAASATPFGLGSRARNVLMLTHLGLVMLGVSCIWITWSAVCM